MKQSKKPQNGHGIKIICVFGALIILLIIGIFLLKKYIIPAQPVDNPGLAQKVSTYMESFGVSASSPDGSKQYCDSIVYGSDSQYVYAWVHCEALSWRYFYVDSSDDSGTVTGGGDISTKIGREVHSDSESSMPVRLEYNEGSDYEFTRYDLPGDGTQYAADMQKLFPMHIATPSNHEIEKLEENIIQRFHQENDDTPLPNYID